jgi:hypothetical protein
MYLDQARDPALLKRDTTPACQTAHRDNMTALGINLVVHRKSRRTVLQ